MSVGPTRGPVQRPGDDRDFTELFQRVEDLERFPPGRWIYVGSYPADPGTTPDSPPFENGWVNVGGGAQRLRFRRNSDWSLDIEGSVIGGVAGSAGSVVTTLNALYRPSEDIEAPGVGGSWLLMATGELVFFEGGDSDLTCDPCAEIAAHIADTEDAHMASAIGYLGSSDLPSDNVQDALDYLLSILSSGGVTSLSKSGSALLTGDVTLTGGSGVTLTQAGQDISIAASGGAGGLDYVTRSTDLAPTATSAATAQDYIVGNAVSYGGSTAIKIECFIPFTNAGDSAHELTLNLWDGGTDLGSVGKFDYSGPCAVATILTPSAGSHTYKIKAWRSGGTGGRQFSAGAASASGVLFNSFYRVVQA